MIDRRAFYEQQAALRLRETSSYYQQLLRADYAFLVPPERRVLELGCGTGDLLAAVKPARGLGIDFSTTMVRYAQQRHAQIEFQVGSAEEFSVAEQFDFILLSDLVNDLSDVQAVFERLHAATHARSRVIVNFFSNLWRPLLHLGEGLGLKGPTLSQNWLSVHDVINLFHLSGWEVVKAEPRILCPLPIPLVKRLLNRWLAPFLPHLCLTAMVIARPQPNPNSRPHCRCSIIVPVRNEAENIEQLIVRTPMLGLGTELIFVEGHSTDKTWERLRQAEAKHTQHQIRIMKQHGTDKGDAVREGFAVATGDLLLILDGDLTVPPEELTKFYEAARSGKAEFVNGVRLVYPMEDEAMRFLNMVANKIFSLAFSWLLGQKIKDTLCGTKVLFREDYRAMASNRTYFGEFDPFGDFDLLFCAAKLNLRMVDLPVRYRARCYGQTNIHRWRHGWLLLRMAMIAARRLKFHS